MVTRRADVRDHRAANGVVYVRSENELGIVELDGRERWRELTDDVVPQVARGGLIAGLGTGGIEIGQNAGDSWSFVPGYLALDNVVFRIDTKEPRVSDHTSNELRSIAVDAHGDLLVLARRCVRRLHADSRREDELVCGPARS
jgi:hypothetical protein